jgi:HEAT repeat protein
VGGSKCGGSGASSNQVPRAAKREVVMDEEVLSGLPDFEFDLDSAVDSEGSDLDAEIAEFFIAFVKTSRAAQLYVQGNPLLHQFVEDLKGRLSSIFDRVPSLSFTIHESELRWLDKPVYKEKLTGGENIAFQLYRDGIRRIEFLPGVEEDELRHFIDVLRLSRTLKEDEDDLLTLMWNADFTFIRYEYVDVLGDEPPVPTPDMSHDAGTELPALPELELAPELQTPTLREDFEPSLYFLDETDVAHLQQELRYEMDRPVKKDVTVAVLDQYELGDAERRGEIVDVLRQMLPRVLAEGGFSQASYIVAELKVIAERKGTPEIVEEVDEIIGELSEPIVLEQLVRIMEDGTIDPDSEALATLLSALKPEAIVTLIKAIPLVARKQAREQLLATMDRLAALKPQLMSSLIRSEDPRVAAEASRIAGRLKLSGAAEAIAGLLDRNESEVRLAAVESLVALHTSMAGGPLVEALADDSRDVRVAAAKGLAAMRYSPAAERLEAYITGKDLWRRDPTEQLAFFEAFARAAGREGTLLLSRMLNGRRVLWLRYPSKVRACAARALGVLGGLEAEQALNVAEHDRDPLVLSAVHAARREPPPDEEKKPEQTTGEADEGK